MAQKVLVQLVDDLDGTDTASGEGEAVLYGLDCTAYETDLCAKNAEKHVEQLTDYIEVGRKTLGTNTAKKAAPGTGSGCLRGPRVGPL